MASRYPSQTFEVYEPPQWPLDAKSTYSEDASSSILDDKVLDSTTPVELAGPADSQNLSLVKSEGEYSTAGNMWPERPHTVMHGVRHYSQPIIPTISTQQPYLHSYATPYHHQGWSMSSGSGTSTPTPMFGQVSTNFHSSPTMSYHQGGPVTFTSVQPPQTLDSAISMSPQSSQGGWPSAASSDSTEQPTGPVRSPSYRAVSPSSAMRPDGVRKKNARFEIPKERNLQNIDALIMSSKDEAEKKELKQQKRLLRNRQAALDSRQRKKTHTEKLEQEKKLFTQQKQELEDALQAAHDTLQSEREHWLAQQQQYDHYIHSLEYERDEAIRTKTIETAELRRKNSILRDHIRDLERQNTMRQYNVGAQPTSNDFSNDFSTFSNLGIEDDNWDEFNFMTQNEDLKMELVDSMTQQSTPKPHSVQTTLSKPAETSSTKSEVSFWNAFYMCLLFGAFVATNSSGSSKASKAGVASSSTVLPDSGITIPPLSEDYRAEAGNVLKAVLNSNPDSLSSLSPPSRQANSAGAVNSLEALQNTLTTPTPAQRAASAFSMSADSYNHITNPDADFMSSEAQHDPDVDADADPTDFQLRKPSALESALAHMQSEREASGVDRILGRGANSGGHGAQAGSLLWERVPEKVLRDFREMVRRVGGEIGE